MRRTLSALVLVAVGGVVAAMTYSSFTTEQEFVRLVAAGDTAVAEGRAFEALEAYSGALALVPDAAVPYLKRGRVYQQEGQPEAALRDLRHAAEIDPSATRPLEWLGDISLELDRLDRAIDYFRSYVALDDRNPRVLHKLGVALYRSGALGDAIASLDRALELDPSLADARFVLGLCQRDLGDLPAARRALERVVADSPAKIGPRDALAEIYLSLDQHQLAIDQLEALATLDPARPQRLVAVGQALARSGRDSQAVLVLGRAVERFPDSPEVYAALGHVWLAAAERRGERVALLKAVEALTESANHATSSSEAMSDLGRALTIAGDLPGAERALRQAVARLPVSVDAFARLAAVAERQGHLLEARDALLQFVALVGDREPRATVATRIADLSLRLGEPLLAVRWFDRSLDDAGPSAPLLARVADAALKGGDFSRARDAIEAGLALAPGDPVLMGLKRRVASAPASRADRLPGN